VKPDHALALHGETLHVGERTWCAHLIGARVTAGWRWVRVALYGVPSYTVLLKVSLTADSHDVANALEWWLLSPGREDGDVIEVL